MWAEKGRPLTVAGDMIVGFPTENEQDFELSKDLLRRARYKNCFIFKYSARPGTTAIERFADDVPEAVKRRRNNEMLALQNQISGAVGAEFVGQTLEVFVEGRSQRQQKQETARRTDSTIGLTINGRSPVDGEGASRAGTCGADRVGAVLRAGTDGAFGAPVQYCGRTEGDLIVFFAVSGGNEQGMTGSLRRIQIESATTLALHGRL